VCAYPSCSDKVKNDGETDVDCGGNYCKGCGDGKGCKGDKDCASAFCNLTTGKCAKPTCTDKAQNGAETDIDCGGGTCPACATGKKCKVGKDCGTGNCKAGVCKLPDCKDGVKNGAETDIDCGGGTCPKCAVSKACKVCGDCAGGYCGAGKCATASSCKAIKAACASAADGVYTIAGTGGNVSAYCEMTFLGGGWLAVYNMMKLPSNTTGAATMYKSIVNRAAMSAPVKPDSSSKSVYTSGISLKGYTEVVYGWAASSSADVTRYGTSKKSSGLASDCYLAKTCSNNASMGTFSIMPQKITRTLYTGNQPTYPHVGIGWTGQQILWGYDRNQSSHGPWANWVSSSCCYSGNNAEAAKSGWRYVIYIR